MCEVDMRYVLFVAADGLDALEGEAILRKAPHSRSFRIVCADMWLAPESAEAIFASTPPEAWEALDSLPRPSLVVVVGNTPLALWASMWGLHRSVPVMHHHAGLRGRDPDSDKVGVAIDATADLLSFIASRDQRRASFSLGAARVIGWPSMEVWARAIPPDAESGASGCLALLGRVSPNQYGRVAKIIDACMHACRRFSVYASEDFRDMIVKVGVPLPDGFEMRVPSAAAELATAAAKCRMLVTNDERLQALAAATGRHVALVGSHGPSIRWLVEQGHAKHIEMSSPRAAADLADFWTSIPGESATPVPPDASSAMVDWVRPFL